MVQSSKEAGPDDVPKPSASKIRTSPIEKAESYDIPASSQPKLGLSPVDKRPDDIPEPSTSSIRFSPIERAEDPTRKLSGNVSEHFKPKKRIPSKKPAIPPIGKGPDDVPESSKPKMRSSPVWSTEDAPWHQPASPLQSVVTDDIAVTDTSLKEDEDTRVDEQSTQDHFDPQFELPVRHQVNDPHALPLQADDPSPDHHPSLANSATDISKSSSVPYLPPPETHTQPPEPTKSETFTATKIASLNNSQQSQAFDAGKLSLNLSSSADAPPSFTITLRIEVSIAPSNGGSQL